MGYGKVAPAPVRSTDCPEELAVEDAVAEPLAPSFEHPATTSMRAASFIALIEWLLDCFIGCVQLT
jgi:hypothetical protein